MSRKRQSRHLARCRPLYLLPLLAGLCGCVTSQHPLSAPIDAEQDAALYGLWRHETDFGGIDYLLIGREKNMPIDVNRKEAEPGLMRMIWAIYHQHDNSIERPPSTCRVFTTTIGDEQFLNCYFDYVDRLTSYGVLRAIEVDEDQFEERMRTRVKVHRRGYLLLKYRVTDDRLDITQMDVQATEDLVKRGVLSGEIDRTRSIIPFVCLTDSSDELFTYLNEGGADKVFPEKLKLTYRRMSDE